MPGRKRTLSGGKELAMTAAAPNDSLGAHVLDVGKMSVGGMCRV